MPDPQPKKPRWSLPPPEAPAPTPTPAPPPPKKPLPAAKPIPPAGATPPPPTKPLPVKPQPTKPQPLPPSARPRPTPPLPTPPLPTPPPPTQPAPVYFPPAPVAEPKPLPVAEPEVASAFNLAGLGAKLCEILAIPGVPFAVSLVSFTIVPMVVVLLFFPSRSAEIEVRIVPADAQATVVLNRRPLTLDAEGRGRTRAALGTAKIAVTAPGYQPITRELSIAGGEHLQTATIELIPDPKKPAPQPAEVVNVPPTPSNTPPSNPPPSVPPPTPTPIKPPPPKPPEVANNPPPVQPPPVQPPPSNPPPTRPPAAGQSVVEYSGDEIAPSGKLAYAKMIIPRIVAKNAWDRHASSCSLEIDEAKKVVRVDAPPDVHHEIELFLQEVRNQKARGNTMDIAIATRMKNGGLSWGKEGVMHINLAPTFQSDQWDLLHVFPYLRGVDSNNPQFTGAGIGKLAGSTLESLNFRGSGFNDAVVPELVGLSNLKQLTLANTRISDAGLTALAEMKRLTYLDVSQTAISDAGAETIAGCRELKVLNLSKTQVTDRGFGAVFKSLSLHSVVVTDTAFGNDSVRHYMAAANPPNSIDLRRTRVDREGFKLLAEKPSLHFLAVGGGGLKAADLAPLIKLKVDRLGLSDCTIDTELVAILLQMNVNALELEDCSITAAAELASHPVLKRLNFVNTDLTDDGLDELVRIPKVHFVFITGRSKVTPEKVAELKKSHSNVNIGYNRPPPK